MINLYRMAWGAYDLAYLINNYRTYAQIGYLTGMGLNTGVDTILTWVLG